VRGFDDVGNRNQLELVVADMASNARTGEPGGDNLGHVNRSHLRAGHFERARRRILHARLLEGPIQY
jgi:hypothetical protein